MSRRLDLICRQAITWYGPHALVEVSRGKVEVYRPYYGKREGTTRTGSCTQDAIERMESTCVPQRREW